jgi:biotin synthase-related radical SAM superfamily protein
MKDKVRVSMGTLRVLGLELLETEADPTTAYLQTYYPGRCKADCGFCAQARSSCASSENIARGWYPERDTKEIVVRLGKAYKHNLLKRACIQTMNYENMLDDLSYLIKEIRKESDIPISVSVFPLEREQLQQIKKAGANNLVIPLDACTQKIFDAIKGEKAGCDYRWNTHLAGLSEAVSIYGKQGVGTHLIIGLGETEEEAVSTIQMLAYMGVHTALFAYTPIEGVKIKRKPPEIGPYRRIQLATHLIANRLSDCAKMDFFEGKIIDYGITDEMEGAIIESGEPFMTMGCEDCNRPFSTESPAGIIYNYPRKPTEKEIEKIKEELDLGI